MMIFINVVYRSLYLSVCYLSMLKDALPDPISSLSLANPYMGARHLSVAKSPFSGLYKYLQSVEAAPLFVREGAFSPSDIFKIDIAPQTRFS